MKTLKNFAFLQDFVHLHSLGLFLVEYSSDFEREYGICIRPDLRTG